MIALYIIMGTLVFFSLLSFLKLTVDINCVDDLSITLKILFFRFTLYPIKEKKINPAKFKIKKFRKMRRKQEKLLRKKLKAKEKKNNKNKKSLQETDKKQSIKDKLGFYINLIKHVIAKAAKSFGRYLTVLVYKIDITVGGSEPDKTAIKYGEICQAVAYINEILNQNLNVKYKGREKPFVNVRADFLSDKSSISAHIAFSIRTWHIIAVCISALLGYLKMPKAANKNKSPQNASMATQPDKK